VVDLSPQFIPDQARRSVLQSRSKQHPIIQVVRLLKSNQTKSNQTMMLRRDSSEGSSNIPRSFYCPLTLEVMVDPVIDAEGNTFERQALMHWLSHYGTSPVSRQPLNANLVVPNFALRDIIHEAMGSSWVAQRTEELGHQYSFSSLAEFHDDDLLQPNSLDNSSSSHSSYIRSRASKHRGKMQCYLKKLSQDVGGGMQLQLDDSGLCMFSCENMTIVVEVPEDAGFFFVYTVVTVPTLSEESKDMMLELNRLQNETREYIMVETRLADVSSLRHYLTCFVSPGSILQVEVHCPSRSTSRDSTISFSLIRIALTKSQQPTSATLCPILLKPLPV
jgi:U-box domain